MKIFAPALAIACLATALVAVGAPPSAADHPSCTMAKAVIPFDQVQPVISPFEILDPPVVLDLSGTMTFEDRDGFYVELLPDPQPRFAYLDYLPDYEPADPQDERPYYDVVGVYGDYCAVAALNLTQCVLDAIDPLTCPDPDDFFSGPFGNFIEHAPFGCSEAITCGAVHAECVMQTVAASGVSDKVDTQWLFEASNSYGGQRYTQTGTGRVFFAEKLFAAGIGDIIRVSASLSADGRPVAEAHYGCML